MRQRKWNRDLILQTIRTLHQQNKDISYNALARVNQPLVSASNYHYGSYRRAVMMAGIDYDEVIRKPRWSQRKVIAALRQAKREGLPLNWRSVSARHDELGRAAAAAVKPRLFGHWNDALQAAGLKPERISLYQHWGAERVLEELRTRHAKGKSINSGTIQKQIPGLYGAAVRHFGSYEDALAAAKIDPRQVRQRRVWSKREVLDEIKRFHREHKAISRRLLRKHDPSLLKAVGRYYASLENALRSAGISAASESEQGMLFVEASRRPTAARHVAGRSFGRGRNGKRAGYSEVGASASSHKAGWSDRRRRKAQDQDRESLFAMAR